MKLLFVLLSVGSFLLHHGASFADSDEVSVMEGDSVTLNTCVKKKKQEDIRWYYNDIRIAQINGDKSKTCTDVQCNEGTERFRDRLKLDNQTGSLTITNIRNTDAGEYTLKISSSSGGSEKIFSVSVHGVSAAEQGEMKKKEGESVTLNLHVKINTNDVMWYFNNTLIAKITGNQSKIYTDVQCKERFRDRLELDHQTGSLTIMNITNTHSGEYKLQINISSSNRHRRSISNNNIEIFKVTVTGSGPPAGVAGIVVGVLVVVFVAAAVGVIYYRRRSSRNADQKEDEHGALEATPINKGENDKDVI